jgi:hypothetical protein
MISSPLTSILLGKHYIGIEHFSLGNEEKIALLRIEKNQNELIIIQKDLRNYSEILPEKWDKNLPFYLVINTNNVIQKEIEDTDSTDEKLLHKAFPNVKWDDFYFEIWRLRGKSIIAISRKSYVDELLDGYKKQGVLILGISLGVCSIAEILSFSDNDKLSTNQQSIILNDDAPIIKPNVSNSVVTYDINGLSIQNKYLLAFSGIVRLLLNNSKNTGNVILHNQILYDTYNQKSFFRKGFKIMIGIVLSILVINFFIFNYYYKNAEETSQSLLISKSSIERINNLKRRIILKEQNFKNLVTQTASKSSYNINAITKNVPFTITLTELNYHPLEKKVKTEELINTQEKIITILGTTIDNKAFTQWIETIDHLKWIDEVVITHFGKNELNETEFAIKLKLK